MSSVPITKAADPMLGTEEAAAYLGLSVHTLEMWRRGPVRGPLFVRLGKAVRYRQSDLEAFISENKSEASS